MWLISVRCIYIDTVYNTYTVMLLRQQARLKKYILARKKKILDIDVLLVLYIFIYNYS